MAETRENSIQSRAVFRHSHGNVDLCVTKEFPSILTKLLIKRRYSGVLATKGATNGG
jgi:hypothetical protein